MSDEIRRRYHQAEHTRIKGELERLPDTFSPGGIVRTILRERIEQEHGRSISCSSGRCSCGR